MVAFATESEEWDIERVKPYPKNAKKHPDVQIRALARQIKEHGWDQAIVVDAEGVVCKGHGRLLAAQHLGLKTVPVIVRTDLSPAQVRLARIADNKLAETDWDMEALKEELAELKDLDVDIDLSGFGMEIWRERFAKPSAGWTPLHVAFIVPPFSILDCRAGYWTDRKSKWKECIQDEGESRQGTLATSELMNAINAGVSILDPVLAEVCVRWFSMPKGTALDPFAGDTVFGYVAKACGLHFTGIELRPEQARLNQARCDTFTETTGSATYHNDTSENILQYVEPESQDFLFSCPPYYDLEVYSDDPRDLSKQETYEEFRTLIGGILHKAIRCLRPNRFAGIVIGEIRDPKGVYRGFVPDIIRIMCDAGLAYYNELVLVSPVGNAQLRAKRQMNTRKPVKLHQNMLVFYKGDPAQVSKVFPKLTAEDMGAAEDFAGE